MDNINTQIKQVTGFPIVLRGNDIDTDRIIPARYLTTITFKGIGKFAFYDERYDKDDREREHPFNDKKFKNASILFVNDNFGCGSSREHAPQALRDFGIKAIVGESFAEIFIGNCNSLGIPCVCLSKGEIEKLQNNFDAHPSTEIIIDLVGSELRYENITYTLTIIETIRKSLITGMWDSTGTLLGNLSKIHSREVKLPYLSNYQG